MLTKSASESATTTHEADTIDIILWSRSCILRFYLATRVLDLPHVCTNCRHNPLLVWLRGLWYYLEFLCVTTSFQVVWKWVQHYPIPSSNLLFCGYECNLWWNYVKNKMKLWCNLWGNYEKIHAGLAGAWSWDLKISKYVEYLMLVSSEYITNSVPPSVSICTEFWP